MTDDREVRLNHLYRKPPERVTLRYHENFKLWTPDEGVPITFRVYGQAYTRAGERFYRTDLVDCVSELPEDVNSKRVRDTIKMVLAAQMADIKIRDIHAQVLDLDSIY